jgi:hypothetical protein
MVSTMESLIDRLLAREDVANRQPGSPCAIDSVLARINATLPAALLYLWQHSDGLALDTINAHMLGPKDADALLTNSYWGPFMCAEGFVPVLDDCELNLVAAAVRGPLTCRLVYLWHESGLPRILYRDFLGFVKDLCTVLDTKRPAAFYLHDSYGDYPPDSPRPADDRAAARSLLATDGARFQWNYAVQLLDESDINEWARLLETDHFVRRDVIARMRQMTSAPIKELLQRDEQAFAEFTEALADTLRSAGFRVGARQGIVLPVEQIGLSLESFFHRRKIRDAQERFLAWITDQLEGRDPRKRPGNAFAN